MTVFCLGSINADHVYRLASLPKPGETLTALSHTVGLGGKGVNQSVAALRAGVPVVHIGAVGEGDTWIKQQLQDHGISLEFIARSNAGTGHAIVAVDASAENQIIIHQGANQDQSPSGIDAALSSAIDRDILLLQNETSHQAYAAQKARARGMRVFYSAAPFDVDAVRTVLPHVTHLLMNAGEAAALVAALGVTLDALPVQVVVVTHGAKGAEWIAPGVSGSQFVPGFQVKAVDTTGAGDCFAGNLAASLAMGSSALEAMVFASAAAALQVGRPGAAPAMPFCAETIRFISA